MTNWTAVGGIAELVGAVGVVVTLLYLAVQIRQNTKAFRAATFQSIIGYATGFAEGIARDGELATLFLAGMADVDALNETEKLRFHFQLVALLRRYENLHYLSRMGHLDDSQWEGLRASLDFIMNNPGSHAWWTANARLFNATFRDFMDRRLAAAGAR